MEMKFGILLLLTLFQHAQSFTHSASYRVTYRSFSSTASRCSPLSASMNNEPADDDLESLFNQIKDIDPEDVPEDIQMAIRDKISQNAPADWKIRLNLMGFNPVTIAGYILAAVIITCNNIFGAGWAGDVFGMNEIVTTDRTQIPRPRIGSNEKFSNSYDGVIRTEIQTIELNSKENLL